MEYCKYLGQGVNPLQKHALLSKFKHIDKSCVIDKPSMYPSSFNHVHRHQPQSNSIHVHNVHMFSLLNYLLLHKAAHQTVCDDR